jgi:hypothetical protein
LNSKNKNSKQTSLKIHCEEEKKLVFSLNYIFFILLQSINKVKKRFLHSLFNTLTKITHENQNYTKMEILIIGMSVCVCVCLCAGCIHFASFVLKNSLA